MRVRCWGARGSIAVSGPEFATYGGDTTCLEIRDAAGRIVVVDAGTGLRRLGNALVREGARELTMLFTHAHWDHIMGFPFFKPIYDPETSITIHSCPMRQGNMETLLSGIMSPPYFPIAINQVKADLRYHAACSIDHAMRIHGLEVHSIPLSHPNLGLGYKFSEAGRTLVFLTDNELSLSHRGGRNFEEYLAFCKGADLLIHDAEYTGADYAKTRGWGHSTYKDALRLAIEAGVRQFGLFHHNQDRPDAEIDAIVEECRAILADEGVDMACFGVTQEWAVDL